MFKGYFFLRINLQLTCDKIVLVLGGVTLWLYEKLKFRVINVRCILSFLYCRTVNV